MLDSRVAGNSIRGAFHLRTMRTIRIVFTTAVAAFFLTVVTSVAQGSLFAFVTEGEGRAIAPFLFYALHPFSFAGPRIHSHSSRVRCPVRREVEYRPVYVGGLPEVLVCDAFAGLVGWTGLQSSEDVRSVRRGLW